MCQRGATTGPLTVTTPGGSATSSGSFTVTMPAPPPPPTTTTTTAYYSGVAKSVNGALSYLLSDPVLGSTAASVSTTSGAVTASQLYSPYGAVRYQSGILPTDYGFTHQRADAATGLDYDNARYYDPVAGQFTSADTTLAGGLNRYAYVAGNPETLVDPTGHVYIESGTEVNGLPDVGPTDTGTPGINLGPLIGGIGATLAAFGLWVHSQFVSSPTPARPPVLARSQSNAMAAWNAYVPPSSDARHQTNALDAAQIASGGGGGGGSGSGGGGGGTVPRTPPPTENGEAAGFGAPILAEDVLAECDPQLPTAQYCIGWTRWQAAFVPGQKWFNSEHALTNGTYKVNSDWMKPHLPGSQSGRSVFSPNVNAEVAVLDAAQFADENGLWDMLKPNRAVVQMSGIVGTTDTGQDTQWIAVSRRKSGWIHGWPEEAPSG